MDGYFDCHISCMSVVGYLRQQMFVCCRVKWLVVTCLGWLRILNGRMMCGEAASAFAIGTLFLVMFVTMVRGLFLLVKFGVRVGHGVPFVVGQRLCERAGS